jgi:hypothetical protein
VQLTLQLCAALSFNLSCAKTLWSVVAPGMVHRCTCAVLRLAASRMIQLTTDLLVTKRPVLSRRWRRPFPWRRPGRVRRDA